MHEEASRLLFMTQIGGLTEEICQLRRWQIFERQFPLLDVGFRSNGQRSIRIRMRCDAFNELAPSIELLSMDGIYLTEVERDPGGVFNSSPHPATGRPFICMRGSREYHQHSSHITDLWDHLKNQPNYELDGILTQVWRAWSRIQ